jgi:hypothetical protein
VVVNIGGLGLIDWPFLFQAMTASGVALILHDNSARPPSSTRTAFGVTTTCFLMSATGERKREKIKMVLVQTYQLENMDLCWQLNRDT